MRTWEQNRQAINELWPLMEFTGEERKLWTDDLSSLNQDLLYDALRNVKRDHDTNYPQLKWVRDEYRELFRASKVAAQKPVKAEPRQIVDIPDEQNERYREELKAVIEMAVPSDFEKIEALIIDKCGENKITAATAFRLCKYLADRTGRSNGGFIS